jgi:peptide/nickel transport system substrate-binding protein
MGKKRNSVRGMVVALMTLGALIFVVAQPGVQAKDPEPGEPVILKSWLPNWPISNEMWRILSADLEKLGIQVELKTGNLDEWVGDIIGVGNRYHFVTMAWGGGTDRLEPDFFLTEWFHSSRATKGGRNYGSYINKEYDKIADAQRIEMDRNKRQVLVRKAQKIVAKDHASFPVFHHDYIHGYNTERVEGVIPVPGCGIGFPYNPWTLYKAKPKTAIREVRLANIHDIQTLNPLGLPEAENDAWLRLMYDTFVKYDPDLNLVPWAAESWKIVDNTTVDIVLRDGMKFHDGKPVTVADVKFTFDYIKKWEFPAYTNAWKNIKSIDIMEGRRIRFKLVQPFAPFVANVLGYVPIIPKHIWEKIPETVGVAHPSDWPNPKPIASGPYEFVEWKKAEYLHLKANKNHFMAPNFDGMYVIVNPTLNGIINMLEKGEIEIMAWNMDGKQAQRLNALPNIKAVAAPNHGLYEIRPNLKMKPTDDLAFRKAIHHAINQKAMLDIILGGYGRICTNTPITPVNKFWNDPEIPAVEFDLNKAKNILKDAGYTWDQKGRLCYPKK